MKLFPDNYRNTFPGRAGPLSIEVESGDEGGVLVTFEADHSETLEDRDVTRELLPEEADELAAMLRHHARAQRRRWRR